MKKILFLVALVALFVYGCQQKEEPKQQFQPPVGQVPPGGPGAPGHGVDTAKLLQEEVKKDPKNVNAWVELGNLMMDTRRFQEAIDAYTKALELDPRNVNVRADMGTCYRYIGKPDSAVREYKKVLEVDPRHLNARKNMAIVLAYDLHDNTQAVKEFEKVLEMEPNSPDADRIRAEIQKLKGPAK